MVFPDERTARARYMGRVRSLVHRGYRPGHAEPTFLASIRAQPDDLALRLRYADWLAQHDDPRAELIRVQIALLDDPQNATLREAEHRLLTDPNHWLVHPAWCGEFHWRAGFLETVEFDGPGVSSRAQRHPSCEFARFEVRHRRAKMVVGGTDLRECPDDRHTSAGCDLLPLTCRGRVRIASPADLALLTTSPAYQQVTSVLAQGPHLRDLSALGQLKHLGILDAENVAGLGAGPGAGSPNLKRIQIHGCPGLEDLAMPWNVQGVESLRIMGCPRLSSLRGLSKFQSLQELWVRHNQHLRDMAELAAVTTLVSLHLAVDREGTASLPVLTCPQLRSVFVEVTNPTWAARQRLRWWLEDCKRRLPNCYVHQPGETQ